MRLIDADAPVKYFEGLAVSLANVECFAAADATQTAAETLKLAPTIDAVPRDEYELLSKRFRHLLESDFIRSFDEYDPTAHAYKRDISEADKIESLVAELEHTKQERDGLSAMLTSAQSAAETHKRKLDAALADMKAIAEKTGCCHCCTHQPNMNPDGSCDRFDPQNPGECWEWRGTHEKDRTLRADRADRTGTV